MIFFFVFLSLVVGSAYSVLEGLVRPASLFLPWLYPIHAAIYGIGLLSLLAVLYGRRRYRGRAEPVLQYWASTYFSSLLGFHSLFFLALLCYGLALKAFAFAHFSIDSSLVALLSLGAAYFLALCGVAAAYMGPRILRASLGNPEAKKKFKIVQISDLHIGATIGESYVRNTVEKTMACAPDCIVLTGDIGDGDPRRHSAAIRELGKLSAPLGVFLILGNHELYGLTEDWIKAYRSARMDVLRDETRELQWNGSTIRLLGLVPMGGKTVAAVLGDRQSRTPLIVLAHYPDRAPEAAQAGALLFLAGHTHGGQFWPWSWLIHAFHRHAKGLYRLGETSVYVSRGTGYWGAPLRFGARAEITLLELGLG